MKTILALAAGASILATPAANTATIALSNTNQNQRKIEKTKEKDIKFGNYQSIYDPRSRINDGTNFHRAWGMYIDKKKDVYPNTPSENGFENKIWSQKTAKNSNWYENNILDYQGWAGNNKEYWLKQNEKVTLTMQLKYNTWNSKYGWTFAGGKQSPYVDKEFIFNLAGKDYIHDLVYYTDASHSSNERVKFAVKEEWTYDKSVGWHVTFNLSYQSMIQWKSGSNISHAAIIAGRNTSWELNEKEDVATKLDTVVTPISFTTDKYGQYTISINNFLYDIEEKKKHLNPKSINVAVAFNIILFNNPNNNYQDDYQIFQNWNNGDIIRKINDILNGKDDGKNTNILIKYTSTGMSFTYANDTHSSSYSGVYRYAKEDKKEWYGILRTTILGRK
ncbi:hypothetical protein [Mesoplasma lactucae]|uniref:Uncharacterized protein n=1 Tax=Mesoplasma lactucae ATCC 49193 TaxID=81460 RepID=A0A291IRZ8_9MOLU|nr:hypothetical protein [Mesoplasma lactucae]ATG97518.1 hypothetical protein CP520_01990 [Mesoplasma lactucae ATCC 49193]ATZ20026.1 hypothetical protein MLACT_v1c02040 [Mesoplasma lactucae ATCC 49193]MCL8217023.1 hypothetical protein [Mesoplasma lactucae ATCC 49193]